MCFVFQVCDVFALVCFGLSGFLMVLKVLRLPFTALTFVVNGKEAGVDSFSSILVGGLILLFQVIICFV